MAKIAITAVFKPKNGHKDALLDELEKVKRSPGKKKGVSNMTFINPSNQILFSYTRYGKTAVLSRTILRQSIIKPIGIIQRIF